MNYLNTHEVDALLGEEFRPGRKIKAKMPSLFWPLILLATLFFFWFAESGAVLSGLDQSSRAVAVQKPFVMEAKIP